MFCNHARLTHLQVGELLSGSTTVLVIIKPSTGMNTGKLGALFSLRYCASLAELMNSNKETPVQAQRHKLRQAVISPKNETVAVVLTQD